MFARKILTPNQDRKAFYQYFSQDLLNAFITRRSKEMKRISKDDLICIRAVSLLDGAYGGLVLKLQRRKKKAKHYKDMLQKYSLSGM